MENTNNGIEEFKIVVDFIKKQVDDKKIRTVVLSKNLIKFTILDNAIVKAFLKEKGLEKGLLSYILQIELPNLMASILNNVPAMALTNKKSKEEEKIIEQKRKIVENVLVDSRIKNYHLLKSTSKVDLLTSVEWEINSKIFDNTKGKIPNIKYAALNFKTSAPNDGANALSSLLNLSNKENSLCVNCDLVDIEVLIDTLNDIKNALEGEDDVK